MAKGNATLQAAGAALRGKGGGSVPGGLARRGAGGVGKVVGRGGK